MATYGGQSIASNISFQSANLSSSGGAITNQVIVTNSVGSNAVMYIKLNSLWTNNSGAGLNASDSAIQGIGFTGGNWFDIVNFGFSALNTGNTETAIDFGAATNYENLVRAGFVKDPVSPVPTGLAGRINPWIRLVPGTRLIIKSGSIQNGASFRISYQKEEYFTP